MSSDVGAAQTDGEPPSDDGSLATTADAGPTADADDGLDPVGEPAYAAPRIASGAAAAGALFATVVLAAGSPLALVPAGFGAGLLVLGVVRGSKRAVTVASGLLFAGVLLAGVQAARPPALLLGAVGTAIAYDAGRYAVGLGTQLRAGAPTRRAELVRVGATATVVTATAGVGALTFRVGTGGQPSTALVALLGATVLFVWALLR